VIGRWVFVRSQYDILGQALTEETIEVPKTMPRSSFEQLKPLQERFHERRCRHDDCAGSTACQQLITNCAVGPSRA
jgi:hypothetical protein